MKVQEIMTKVVAVLPPDAQLSEVARVMRDYDIGSVPIADQEKLVGMVTDRDIVVRALADGATINGRCARDVMSPKVLYCYEDQSVEEALGLMGEQQVRRLPVLDAERRLVGVVSLGDVSQAVAQKAGGALKEISEPTHH
jgi:CBS domain-containing protein